MANSAQTHLLNSCYVLIFVKRAADETETESERWERENKPDLEDLPITHQCCEACVGLQLQHEFQIELQYSPILRYQIAQCE